MRHSQDKGHGAHRAVRNIGDVESLRYALQRRDEAVERRDPEREARANALYEKLRLLSKDELAVRLGHADARQTMIAELIEQELGPKR
jgi:hypothetical protein